MATLAERTGTVKLGQVSPDWSGPDALIEAAVAALRAGHNQRAHLLGVASPRHAIGSTSVAATASTSTPTRPDCTA
jgi:N-succinyldiaminopimelate aminotransferase